MAGSLPNFVVGVDIGGTNMVTALIDGHDARVLSRTTIPTEASRGPEDGLGRLSETIEGVIRAANVPLSQVGGIGVGCTGPLDSERGRIHNPYTLPTWDDVPLIDYLTGRFHVPAVLLNDAHVAALGEYWVGAGRGTRHMIYITVGTGIGGGIILSGHLHRGLGQMSSEVGHQVLDVNGPPCYCGARGCWEALAAGPAIARYGAEHAPDDSLVVTLAGGDRECISARLIADAAMQQDAFALETMRRIGFYMGVGISNLIYVLAPEVVVLGGGVMQSWDLIAPAMFEAIKGREPMVPIHDVRIVRTQLGMNAGVIGAARGLLDHLGTNNHRPGSLI
jgi:glucokinase